MASEPTVRARAPLRSLGALWPLLAAERGLLLRWLGFLALSSTATLALPVAVRLMIDHGFGAKDPGAIDRWFLGLWLVTAVLAAATAGRFHAVSVLGERVVARLRERLYRHLLRLDMAFFDAHRSGELVSRLSADTEQIRSMVSSSLSVALRSLLTLAGSVAMLVATSPRLAALAAVGIPLVVAPIVLFGRRVQAASKESQERLAEANARAAEALGAVATVRSMAREAHEAERYGEALQRALGVARRRIGIQAVLTASVILLVFGAITLVLWLGAKDVIAGRMSAGVLGQFVLYAVLGAGSVGALSEVWAEVQRTAGGLARIRELLDIRPQVVAPAQPRPLPPRLRGEIRFEDVRFSYPSRPETPALEGFSLDIRPGETVALVGPSGAGKSTVLQLLLRLYDPQQGCVRVDGMPLREIDPDALRAQMAVVPQQPAIFAATAADNIRYGRLDASDAEVERAARLAEAHDFLVRLPKGYATWLGERGMRLSGGQQQRIALARAILRDAPILLLDEATSALDAASERSIQHALEHLLRDRTTLVVAHRLATVRRADRIVVMDQGRIVAQGRHEALLAEGGLYAELARLQFVDG